MTATHDNPHAVPPLPPEFKDFFFLPKDLVGYDFTEANSRQFFSALFPAIYKTLAPALHKAYLKAPDVRAPFELDHIFAAAWQLGWEQGAMEITLTKNDRDQVNSIALLTRQKLLTCTRRCLCVDWLWGETQELEDALLARIRRLGHAMLEPGEDMVLCVSRPKSKTEMVLTYEILEYGN